jgi:hypothetical protein
MKQLANLAFSNARRKTSSSDIAVPMAQIKTDGIGCIEPIFLPAGRSDEFCARLIICVNLRNLRLNSDSGELGGTGQKRRKGAAGLRPYEIRGSTPTHGIG